jgi:eukaryotic-like serine/threonine-protein kinase
MTAGVVTPAGLVPGSVIADRYELERSLGAGGMGRVWQAHDRVLDRRVAVKCLRGEYADDASFRARLRAEARAAAAIAHPAVVSVYDFGEEDAPDGGCMSHLVMELVDGEPLSAVLQRGPLSAVTTRRVLSDVAAGLAAAHACGVVHRDIKPANLIVTPDGSVKITDFGIARAADACGLTATGELVGTARYVSPEQVAGEPATTRSDLYSLGIVGYHCLTGQPPFTEGGAVEIALAHLNREPTGLPADVPEDLADLVTQLLAKDPAQRPATADEVARRLNAPGSDVRNSLASTVAAIADDGADASDPGATRVLTDVAAARTAVVPAQPTGSDHDRLRRIAPYGFGLLVLLAVAIPATYAGTSHHGPSRVTVPKLAGLRLGAAEHRVHITGLHYVVRRHDVAGRPGFVITARPGDGTAVRNDAIVTLIVPSGYVRVDEGALAGMTYDQAAAVLRRDGLNPQRYDVYSNDGASGVVAASPSGRVARGSDVVLTVAAPMPEPPAVPPGHEKKPPKPPKHGHGHGHGPGGGDG